MVEREVIQNRLVGGQRVPQIVLVPFNGDSAEVVAMLTKWDCGGIYMWMIMGQAEAMDGRDVARLLALLAIDDQIQIMPAQGFPSGAPIAFMFQNGMLRHSRKRTFHPAVLSEVNRLGAYLLTAAPEFVSAAHDVLAGRRVAGFVPLPSEFPLSDGRDARLAPPLPPLPIDLAALPRKHTRVEAEACIRADYRRDRYMGHLTHAQLEQRLADLMTNVMIVHPSDREAFAAHDTESTHIWIRMIEVQAEMEMRHGPHPAGWAGFTRGAIWPDSRFPDRWHAFQAGLPPMPTLEMPYLVKYGQRQFLEPMLREGQLRISAAASYADASLNSAIHDDELRADLDLNAFGLTAFGGIPGMQAAMSSARTAVTRHSETNYYVFCASEAYQTRLAYDFGADAVLIIRDRGRFEARLRAALRSRLPKWTCWSGCVQYYDPLQVNERQVDLVSWKHFRFAYQREWRLAITPRHPRAALPVINLRMGSLEDIAELVISTDRAHPEG